MKRRLTLAPGQLKGLVDSSGYCPTTKGGKQLVCQQISDDIKRHLFREKGDDVLGDLEQASDQLEAAIQRMMDFDRGITIAEDQSLSRFEKEREEGDDDGGPVWGMDLDTHFSHSWTPGGPGPGYFWIPKGCIDLNKRYRASSSEVWIFGHLARKVRVLPTPPPLSRSFVSVVSEGKMTWNQPRPPGTCRQEEWRQEEWMDEDDLLGVICNRNRTCAGSFSVGRDFREREREREGDSKGEG